MPLLGLSDSTPPLVPLVSGGVCVYGARHSARASARPVP